MKFEINTKTEDKVIIECARHIYAWLMDKDKLKGEKDMSIDLLALANGELRHSSKKCTCKIDKEGNLTIDKACYWHGLKDYCPTCGADLK